MWRDWVKLAKQSRASSRLPSSNGRPVVQILVSTTIKFLVNGHKWLKQADKNITGAKTWALKRT
jgi:hypothetical protein